MTVIRKLQRSHTQADLASVEAMLRRLSDEDFLTRMSLEDRRAELQAALQQEAEAQPETSANAALFFGGRPVAGGRGVESDFGGKAVSLFQDLVAKQLALETGTLAQRGVIPNKSASRLHITNVVRGSFGFQLEELTAEPSMVRTGLKDAVDHTLTLLDAIAHDPEARFQEAVEQADDRILSTAKDFFQLMRDESANFRAVSDAFDKSFDAESINRAFDRAQLTRVEETEERLEGNLLGVLPEAHQFEFRPKNSQSAIQGKVDKVLSADTLAAYNRDRLDTESIAVVTVRRVRKGDLVVRERYTLKELVPI